MVALSRAPNPSAWSISGCRHAYLAPAQAVILVNAPRLAVGDGIAAIDEAELAITAVEDAKFVLVDAA